METTREEAIEEIRYYCQDSEEIIEAINQSSEDCVSRKAMLEYQQFLHGKMSNEENHKLWEFIKDLPPVTPTPLPSEDCVSRQAVLAGINDWWGITSTSGEPTVCDCIRELPPVTPTRKVGHWIDSEILGEFKCSCCGNYWQDAEENEYEDWVNIAKFCPVCGAKMEAEE